MCNVNGFTKQYSKTGKAIYYYRGLNRTVTIGTVENHGKKWQKITADSCENRKNHGKNTTSNHGPKDHYTVHKIQHPALWTIITCRAKFSSVKFCHCGALTNSRKR